MEHFIISVADPDPVPFLPLEPGSGMDKNQATYHISERLETHYMRIGILNLFDPGSGMEKIWIRNKHPGPATLGIIKYEPTCTSER